MFICSLNYYVNIISLRQAYGLLRWKRKICRDLEVVFPYKVDYYLLGLLDFLASK
jgi:hypothetical protein